MNDSENKLKELLLLNPLEFAQEWLTIALSPSLFQHSVLQSFNLDFCIKVLSGHYEDALNYAISKIQQHPELFTYNIDTVTFFSICEYLKVMQGDDQSFKHVFSKLQSEYQYDKNELIFQRMHFFLGKIYAYQNNPGAAIHEFERAFEYSIKIEDSEYVAHCALALSNLYRHRQKKDIKKAISILETTYADRKNYISPWCLAKIVYNLLNIKCLYGFEDRVVDALDNILIELYDDLNETETCILLGMLGTYLVDASYVDVGTTLLNKAIKYSDDLSMVPESIAFRIKCGIGHSWIGEHSEGWDCFIKAKLMLNDYKSDELFLSLLLHMSKDHIQNSAFEDAQRC